jgi:G2/mitotic-specific cyclin-B, other
MATGSVSGGNETVITQSGAFTMDESRNLAQECRDLTMLSFARAGVQADPNSYQMTGNQDNIDERDIDDPLCTTTYVNDMYLHFRGKEVGASVRPLYMENQGYINERMRSILVDWLVEVHLKFKLVPETLYLTVNLIDRFLEKEEVSRPRLQLVGVTSLLIASKYEEIYPPELRDLVYICDKAYTKQDVRTVQVCNS